MIDFTMEERSINSDFYIQSLQGFCIINPTRECLDFNNYKKEYENKVIVPPSLFNIMTTIPITNFITTLSYNGTT